MARNFVLLSFFALVSVQVCLAGPTTTPAPLTLPSFADFVANAQKTINDGTLHVQKMLGLPEYKPDQFIAAIRNASSDFTKKVTDAMSSVKLDIDPNAKAAEAAFKDFFTKVNATAEDLRKKLPELKGPEEIQKFWSQSMKSIVEEGTKLTTALGKEGPEVQEALTKGAQSVIESAVKSVNSFADKVHEAVGHDKHADHAAHHKA